MRFTTPHQTDRALRLTVVGRITGIASAQQDVVVHHRTTNTGAILLVIGRLRTGPVATLSVPDLNAASEYRVQIDEVADTTYALRDAPLTGYSAGIDR